MRPGAVVLQLLALVSADGLQLAASSSRRHRALRMQEEPKSARRSFFERITSEPLPGQAKIKVGDTIIAGNDWNSSSPAYGIICYQDYELQRVYYQGVVDGKVERVDVASLDAEPPPGCAGFTRYLALFNQGYHGKTGPVIVRPTEVQVVAMRDEVTVSAWLALPGLFWVWLAWSFYSYGEANGGAFRGLNPRREGSASGKLDLLKSELKGLEESR